MRACGDSRICGERGDLDLGRRNLCRRNVDIVAQSGHDAADGVSFLVRLLKKTSRDDALRVQHERAGERNAVRLLVGFRNRRVEDAVPFDRCGSWIRQHRVRNAAPLGEIGKDGHRVGRDRGDADACLLQPTASRLQFRELRFAIRTPVGRTREDQHQTVWSHQRLQRPLLAVLVRQREVGHFRAGLRAKRLDVRQCGVLRVGRLNPPVSAMPTTIAPIRSVFTSLPQSCPITSPTQADCIAYGSPPDPA